VHISDKSVWYRPKLTLAARRVSATYTAASPRLANAPRLTPRYQGNPVEGWLGGGMRRDGSYTHIASDPPPLRICGLAKLAHHPSALGSHAQGTMARDRPMHSDDCGRQGHSPPVPIRPLLRPCLACISLDWTLPVTHERGLFVALLASVALSQRFRDFHTPDRPSRLCSHAATSTLPQSHCLCSGPTPPVIPDSREANTNTPPIRRHSPRTTCSAVEGPASLGRVNTITSEGKAPDGVFAEEYGA
jgi:hypothetical protein